MRLRLSAPFIAYAQGNYVEAEKLVRGLQDQGVPVEVRRFGLSAGQSLAAMQGRLKQASDDARNVADLAMSQGRPGDSYSPSPTSRS